MNSIQLGTTQLHYPPHTWTPGIHIVTGPSGAGKTTLLKAMHGLLKEGGASNFRQPQSAFMPQQPLWVPYLTMKEHLHGCALPAGALQNLGLEPLLYRLPHQLSVGQNQRFWVLWALAQRKQCTLLDEPTSALDDDWANAVIELIRSEWAQNAERLFVIVTHDLRLKNAFEQAQHLAL